MADEARTPTGKLTAAAVLGITGGVVGILIGLFKLIASITLVEFKASGASELDVWEGVLTVGLGVLGVTGGVLAKSQPRNAAVMLVVAGLAGFVAAYQAWILSGILLLVGAGLAYAGHRGLAGQRERRLS